MQIGDIFYGVDWFAVDQPIEINKIVSVEYNHVKQCYRLDVESIIGTGGIFTFPFDFDLDNNLLTAYYNPECIWIYSKNIDLIVNLNEKILSGFSSIEDISLNAWDEFSEKWITLDPYKI